MWDRIRRWFLPPVFEEEPDKTDSAKLLNAFLLMALAAVIAYTGGTVIVGGGTASGVWIVLGAFSILALGALFLLRQGFVKPVGILVVLLMWALCTALVMQYGGIHDEVVPGYFVAIAAAGLILGGRGLLGFSLLSAVTLAVAYYLEAVGVLVPDDVVPSQLRDLVVLLVLLGLTGFFVRYAVRRLQRMDTLVVQNTRALSEANAALTESRDTLRREQARLTRRLQAAISVTREATAAAADQERLLTRVTAVVAQAFDFYHAALFWVNRATESVELRASSNAQGRRLIPAGYQLPIGQGLVGSVASDGDVRLVRDVTADSVYVSHPNLPDTRSELAVPIALQGEVVGVLDVQSARADAFSDEDRTVLLALVGQLSLAISNARMVQALQADLVAAEAAYQDVIRADWQELMRVSGRRGFLSTADGTSAIEDISLPPQDAQPAVAGGGAGRGPKSGEEEHVSSTSERGTRTPEKGIGSVVRVPVELAGQVIAEVEAYLPETEGRWTAERMELLASLSDQLSQAMERARLYRDMQHAALQQRTIAEVGARIREEVDIEAVLARTLAELGRALAAEEGAVLLTLGGPGEDG